WKELVQCREEVFAAILVSASAEPVSSPWPLEEGDNFWRDAYTSMIRANDMAPLESIISYYIGKERMNYGNYFHFIVFVKPGTHRAGRIEKLKNQKLSIELIGETDIQGNEECLRGK